MSFLEAELSNFLSRPVELYHFQTGNNDFYFTSSDKSVTHNGIVWNPQTIARSNIRLSNDLKRSDLVLRIAQENPMRDYFFYRGVLREMTLTVYRLQVVEDLSEVSFSGTIGIFDVKNELEIEVTFQQIGAIALKNSQRYTYSYKCNHDQYSEKCGLDLDLESSPVTVTEITTKYIKIVDNGEPDQFFQTGTIWYDKGSLREKRYITKDDNTTDVGFRILSLDLSFNNALLTDSFSAARGCRNNSDVCKDIGNFENYLGFEWIPEDNYYTDGIRDDGKGYTGGSGFFSGIIKQQN